jgi:hypothetical protein
VDGWLEVTGMVAPLGRQRKRSRRWMSWEAAI